MSRASRFLKPGLMRSCGRLAHPEHVRAERHPLLGAVRAQTLSRRHRARARRRHRPRFPRVSFPSRIGKFLSCASPSSASPSRSCSLRRYRPERAIQLFYSAEMRDGELWMIRGMMQRLPQDADVEAVPLCWATALPGGPLLADAYAAVKAETLDLLRANGPFDGVLAGQPRRARGRGAGRRRRYRLRVRDPRARWARTCRSAWRSTSMAT